jgi:Ca2+/Na+ antiporter
VILWIQATEQELNYHTLPALVLAIFASVSCLLLTSNGPKPPLFYGVFPFIAKISSIYVLGLVADEITGSMIQIGNSIGVPRLWLSSTVVAWGNSLGDLFAAAAMVRHGQRAGSIALLSVFAGPVFNCLVGFGSLLTFEAMKFRQGVLVLWQCESGPIRRQGFCGNLLLVHVGYLAVATAALSTATLWQSLVMQYYVALFLCFLYAVFLILVLYDEHDM